jgi:hypothetical protein
MVSTYMGFSIVARAADPAKSPIPALALAARRAC